MTYRNDIEALAARHAVLAQEVATKSREVDAAARLLDEAKAKARLPVLPNIRVATPCTADWNAMTGDERVRACGQCNKNVYNLSEMTRDEAEALILAKEGRLCVRYFQRSDGTILLKDCSIGISQKRKRRIIAAGAAALLAGAGGAALMLRSRSVDAPKQDQWVQGEEVSQPIQKTVPDALPYEQHPPAHHDPIRHITNSPLPHTEAKMGGLALPPSAK